MNVNVKDKNEDDNDLYESLRGVTQSQLKAAKQVRQAHRSLAYRPTNAISKLLKEGYINSISIDGKLLRNAEEVFGKPYNKLKSKASKRKSQRINFMIEL